MIEILYDRIIKELACIHYCAECGNEIIPPKDKYGFPYISFDQYENCFCGPVCFSRYHDQILDFTLETMEHE